MIIGRHLLKQRECTSYHAGEFIIETAVNIGVIVVSVERRHVDHVTHRHSVHAPNRIGFYTDDK